MKAFLLALATTVALPAVADAQAFTNGSFETANFDPGAFTQLEAGSTAIAGWSIDSGSIDYVGNYWNASNGVRSIDMSGGVAGSISQTFDTVAGRAYTVSFDLGGNVDAASLAGPLDEIQLGAIIPIEPPDSALRTRVAAEEDAIDEVAVRLNLADQTVRNAGRPLP